MPPPLPDKTHHAGWDSYNPEPGAMETAECRVCGSKMNVERNVMGPTSWAGAMGNINHLHDHFTCPNTGEDWHTQALKLKQYANHLPSKILEELVQDEIEYILKNKKATKKVYF